MALRTEYGPAGEADIAPISRLVGLAFASDPETSEKWLRASGLENFRVLRGPKGVPLASLARIPMAQYFGGRSVPMVGIAGVAVAPEARGGGLALRLMREAVLEMAAERVALSCLYASTQPLYRQVGYEQAGYRFRIRVPLASLGIRERGLTVRPLGSEDEAAVAACYGRFAACFNGMLDRGPYCWGRVRELRGEVYQGFGVVGPSGDLEGYLYLRQNRNSATGRHDVAISDLAFTTARAGRRLAGFLGDMATTGEEAVFYGGPWHPVLGLLPQQNFTVVRHEYWMLRVIDAGAALNRRGYAQPGDWHVEFDLRDGLVPANQGTWRVTRTAGVTQVLKPDAGRDQGMDIRAFAALYSGFMSVAGAEMAGHEGMETGSGLSVAIGSGVPWMVDAF